MRRGARKTWVALGVVALVAGAVEAACTAFESTPDESSEAADAALDAPPSTDGAPDAPPEDAAADSADAACDGASECKARYVFVTSGKFSASFGGLDGGDTLCNMAAAGPDAGKVLAGRTFIAWLASNAESPSTRFVRSTGPYLLVDGTPIAANWTDLTDGTLASPIIINELGNISPNYVWTGATPSGGPAPSNCSSWTDAATNATGVCGQAGKADAGWTAESASCVCNEPNRLYCFEK